MRTFLGQVILRDGIINHSLDKCTWMYEYVKRYGISNREKKNNFLQECSGWSWLSHMHFPDWIKRPYSVHCPFLTLHQWICSYGHTFKIKFTSEKLYVNIRQKNLKTEFEQKRFTPPNKMFVEIGKSSARCYQQCLDWNGNRFEVTGLYVDSFAVKMLTICK